MVQGPEEHGLPAFAVTTPLSDKSLELWYMTVGLDKVQNRILTNLTVL